MKLQFILMVPFGLLAGLWRRDWQMQLFSGEIGSLLIPKLIFDLAFSFIYFLLTLGSTHFRSHNHRWFIYFVNVFLLSVLSDSLRFSLPHSNEFYSYRSNSFRYWSACKLYYSNVQSLYQLNWEKCRISDWKKDSVWWGEGKYLRSWSDFWQYPLYSFRMSTLELLSGKVQSAI